MLDTSSLVGLTVRLWLSQTFMSSMTRSEKIGGVRKMKYRRACVYLSDIRQLQDVREDVQAWGLQQRTDSLGQCRA